MQVIKRNDNVTVNNRGMVVLSISKSFYDFMNVKSESHTF